MEAKNTTKSRFRIHARQFFLTWPKCTLSKEEALAIMLEIIPVEQYVITRELHKDGTPHLHAYIKCSKVVDIRNPHRLDLKEFHGHYQTCRNTSAVIKYCTKEENYITNIPTFQPIAAAIRVIQAENFDNGLEIVKTSPELAKDYLKDTLKYETSISRLYAIKTYQNLKYRFKTMQSILKWKKHKHALLFMGPTGLGKTEYAKSLFDNPLFIRDINGLKELRRDHDGIIFDDMFFADWPREKQIHLLDLTNDSQINVKYSTVTIPRLMPRVFTCNRPIFTADSAIQRRIRLIKIIEDIRLLEQDPELTFSDSSNSLNPSFEDLCLQ